MNNDKFDAITGDKFVCCCDCGKWFSSTEAFTKFYSSTAFMLCPKCANQLEQEIRRYKVEEAPATDVVEVRHGRWICINKRYGEYECSVCHGMDSNCSDYYGIQAVTEQEFCPNCGAKMDKEDV